MQERVPRGKRKGTVILVIKIEVSGEWGSPSVHTITCPDSGSLGHICSLGARCSGWDFEE